MAPRFWSRPAGPVLRALGALAPGKRPGDDRRAEPPVPVVAVGSLSLGGTGKTPTVIALAQRLAMKGRNVHVVTRGPGVPFQISPQGHAAEDVGDEPLLIAAFAPTWLAEDAAEGIAAAAKAGAEIVVLDGGFPARPIRAALTLAVEDAARGFGNGLAWPLGPLKMALAPGLGRADLLITLGPPEAQATFGQSWSDLACPRLAGDLMPLPTGMDWDGLDVLAFAGIGAPERFFATLRGLGARIHRAVALSDHQELTPRLITRLTTEARALGAQLVTTEKDAVRLPESLRPHVLALPVRLELDDWAELDARLP